MALQIAIKRSACSSISSHVFKLGMVGDANEIKDLYKITASFMIQFHPVNLA
jgi:hypothetical protein